MLNADSQGLGLDIADFNIFSLPGACVRHVYNFFPKKDSYGFIVVFNEGNDLFCKNVFSTKSAEDITTELSDLATFLPTEVKRVCVLGIPLRHCPSQRSKTVNKFLAFQKKGWNFRGISGQTYSDKHLKKNNALLTSNALSGIW